MRVRHLRPVVIVVWISVVGLVVIVIVVCMVEARGERRASKTIVHQVRPVGTHGAQCLLLLVSEAKACAGARAIALFTLLEFVFLLSL
jgi:hypothetical protein